MGTQVVAGYLFAVVLGVSVGYGLFQLLRAAILSLQESTVLAEVEEQFNLDPSLRLFYVSGDSIADAHDAIYAPGIPELDTVHPEYLDLRVCTISAQYSQHTKTDVYIVRVQYKRVPHDAI